MSATEPGDQTQTLLVSGFIRLSEKEFKFVLPASISRLCCAAFHSLYQFEYFSRCGEDLHISGVGQQTISKQAQTGEGYGNIALGSHWMDSTCPNTLRWTVKCLRPGRWRNGVIAGLLSKHIDLDSDPRWNEEAVPSYFVMDGNVYCSNYHIHSDTKQVDFGEKDSTLELRLDLEAQSLSFSVDGQPYGLSIEHIERGESIKYKLALSLWYPGQSVVLTRFRFE